MKHLEPVFRSCGERLFMPTDHARGPWDPGALHGGAPAALMAGAVERFEPAAGMFVARLSFEFLRPVPLAALELRIELVRPGRRVQLIGAGLWADGLEVCRLLALRTARVPANAAPVAQGGRSDLPLPENLESTAFALGSGLGESFAESVMEMRFAGGGPELGPADVWMRLRRPVLDQEPPSPLMRVAATADFGNGVAAVVPFERNLFINPDLTIHLARDCESEWVLLGARTLLVPGAGAVAWSVIGDPQGQIGLAAQALLVENR